MRDRTDTSGLARKPDAHEQPLRLSLPRWSALVAMLAIASAVLAPIKGGYDWLVLAICVGTLLWMLVAWKVLGPYTESRPLSPWGRRLFPVMVVAGVAALVLALFQPG